MGDAQEPSGPTRNLIVSSTPPGGYKAQEQRVASEQQPPTTLPTNPDRYITSHPVAGVLGMAALLVQQPPGYRFNQSQYAHPPSFLPQQSHSTPHGQPVQAMHNGAIVPRSLPPHPQISQHGTHTPPNNNQRWQTGYHPVGMAYQYHGGPVSPTHNSTCFAPGYQYTFVDSCGQQYTQVLPQHRDAQAQVRLSSYAVSYASSYPPHYPQSTGSAQTQFPPGYRLQMSPYCLVSPQYVAHQVQSQQPSQPLLGQALPDPCVRRHSFPPRQLPSNRRGSDPEATRTWYPVVPRWGGRTASVGIGARGGGDAAAGGYSGLSARGPVASTNATTSGTLDSSLSSSSSLLHPSLPRGPPRKPKQSGHALWVGNLPTGTRVVDLKEYFSKDAKDDIESVFLISKSNCAFVNYRTEEACSEAMARFHDSRFQNAKLVCRLRRNSAPSAAASAVASIPSPDPSVHSVQGSGDEAPGVGEVGEDRTNGGKSPPVGPKVTTRNVGKDRIFIVKSLTVEDLDLSVRNGIWATQSHNESVLNQAFETADNVYLIFSANKSGEYYGYARMTSPILDDPAELEWTPSSQPREDSDLPRAIYTPATALAPQGRIIDDSARGTIFWEAISNDEVPDPVAATSEEDSSREEGSVAVAKSWGKPFRVEWINTTRVPFYRTRGLRNIWNANREVKIARDGTELEENVGRKLIQLFHRNGGAPLPGNQNAPLLAA